MGHLNSLYRASPFGRLRPSDHRQGVTSVALGVELLKARTEDDFDVFVLVFDVEKVHRFGEIGPQQVCVGDGFGGRNGSRREPASLPCPSYRFQEPRNRNRSAERLPGRQAPSYRWR